ncbi:hypothetical protein [Cyanobium sp. La Preciosa 7G6]|uniref:hypothetical protein n=1 Tax=Cyanobium sp. La Preciosa 7G6 TaxID=2823715 RepID=UPI0020CF8860|nr:hypothetical protein [Cyanobium sp. La Preciosa 7G6]MCP9833497.1 hypothetical protein [Cyanobium sp. La Preciosa 7G6]MCP9936262.1 hypothetical protein [Cyanobium sp. Aljojuca 7A6]
MSALGELRDVEMGAYADRLMAPQNGVELCPDWAEVSAAAAANAMLGWSAAGAQGGAGIGAGKWQNQ